MGKRLKYDQLPAIMPGTRPSVLLTGNGIVRAFDENKKTDKLIQDAWKKCHSSELPERNDKENPHPIWKLPFPMEIVIATKNSVQDCMGGLAGDFMTADTDPCQEELIKEILDTGFDTILSTNYSLEFEKSVFPAFSEGKVKANYKVTAEQTSNQKRLGIFQCTGLPYENHDQTFWHIHGTALRKNSMVIGHHLYGKLMTEVTQHAENMFKIFKSAQTTNTAIRPLSWIDYFLIGDIYIMGFSLDPAETDIWWLLDYKKLFSDSNVFFFEPHISEEKKLLLNCFKVKTIDIPIYQKADGKEDYVGYYKQVLEYIGDNKNNV